MTDERIKQINSERLTSWTGKLTEAHATPLMLVGVGHDHVSGKIVLLAVEEGSGGPSDKELAKLLRAAAKSLER